MKVKRKFLHRVGSVLCALVVMISAFGISSPYYARDVLFNDNGEDLLCSYASSKWFSDNNIEFTDEIKEAISNYKYYIFYDWGSSCILTLLNEAPYLTYKYVESSSGGYSYRADIYFPDYKNGTRFEYDEEELSWSSAVECSSGVDGLFYIQDLEKYDALRFSSYKVLELNFDLRFESGNLFLPANSLDGGNGDSYSGELGYLQNISHKKLWETGKVTYYYDDSSRTDMWSFDSLTTTGVDLTAGNYSIRHYIQPCLVTGYEEDDIVEEYDKYFMGEYDAADLSFQYKRADYDAALEEAGFEGLGFFDSLIGRFILEHQLLQIVNNDTGEVGGYVILRPNDADKSSFGVEYLGKTVTPDGELDLENGYDDTMIDYSSGSGSTLEEAIENSNEPNFDSLAGVESFTNSLNSFSESLGNVPLGLKSIIDLFPWWVQASFGLSFALAFVLVLYKVFR